MKKIFLILCSIFILACPKPGTKPDIQIPGQEQQPTGFLFLKWGDKENVFKETEDCNFDTDLTQVFMDLSAYKCYDIKQIEGVSGFEYRLVFYKSQFFMGTLLFSNSQLDFLTSQLYKKYGPPNKTDLKKDVLNLGKEMYSNWRIGNVLIRVSYNQMEKQAKLSYIFIPVGTALNYRLDQDNQPPLFEE